MAGLGRNDDARTAGFDDLAEFFQQDRRAVKVYFQDCFDRCLRRRYAGGIDEVLNGAELLGMIDEGQKWTSATKCQRPGCSF